MNSPLFRTALLCAFAVSAAPDLAAQDLELRGVRVYTGTGEDWSGDRRIVVRDGRIEGGDVMIPGDAMRIELGGSAWLYPGIVDSHAHLRGLGESLAQVDLVGTRSYEEVVDLVREQAARTPAGTWILGRGWDQNDWSTGRLPSHEELSSSVPDHPVVLTRIDGHALLANYSAMQAAGITEDAESPDGGEIVRDEGAVTGVFVDRAMGLIGASVPEATESEIADRLLAAQRRCLALGITCVHDAGMPPAELEILRRLHTSGQWVLRVYAMLPASAEAEIRKGPWQTPDRRISVRAVKGYADGALGSRGAALLAPYSDRAGWRGLMTTPPAELRRLAQLCADHGFQFCVHAIGDRANREVLDAFAATDFPSGSKRARFRIEHAQIVHEDDVLRFATLGVIPAMQPTHLTSDMPWAPARLGEARIADAYAWRRFLDMGLPVPFGSDFPVERADPRLGFFAAAATRAADGEGDELRPEQKLSRDEILRGFTRHPAFASFFEHDLGTVEVGKLADFTVFDRDLRTCSDVDLREAQVMLTVVGGEVVFAADGVIPPQSRIDPREVERVVGALAADELAGRDSPSEGLERAADWLASGYAMVGLSPLGDDGGYFHRYDAPGFEVDSRAVALELAPKEGEEIGASVRLVGDRDVRILRGGRPLAERSFDAEVEPLRRQSRRRSSAPTMMLVDPDSQLWAVAGGVHRSISSRVPGAAPILLLRQGVIEAGAVRATATVPAAKPVDIELRNLVGSLAGTDLPDEYVLVTAHYDHIGVGATAGDDVVFNGADDNATGVAGVYVLAQQLARSGIRTKRSIVFVCFSAEEKGLLGSRAFVERPPIPLESIVAVVNLEMLGRPGPGQRNRAWITGVGHSDFASIAEPAFARRGVRLVDFEMAERLFFASDNLPFARKGVVAHSVSAGELHSDYHGPNDESDRIDFDHMATVIGAIREFVLDLANRDARPMFTAGGRQALGLDSSTDGR